MMIGRHRSRGVCPQICLLFGLVALNLAGGAFAASALPQSNAVPVVVFSSFVLITLGITVWAATRTRTANDFYTGGGGISPLQNGLAIAGEFMSASTLLGVTGLMFLVGFDAYLLCFAVVVGWFFMLVGVAERARNLGKYTFTDVVTYRLKGRSLRTLLALCTLTVLLVYLIGQVVGAGKLIALLFEIDYLTSITCVSVLMVTYVSFGGMLATTWVQVVKAVLLLLAGLVLASMLLSRFDYSLTSLLIASQRGHSLGPELLKPGNWLDNSFLNTLTVALTVCFGVLGMPHILMRFFTVDSAVAARKSVAYATAIMSLFYLALFVIGFGAVAVLLSAENDLPMANELGSGANMVALHLARALGGDVLFGLLAAVTFATILAVVAGLTLAAAATVAHDLYADLREANSISSVAEAWVSRATVVVIGVLAVMLGLAFENQNIAAIVVIAYSIAASVNFPLLFCSMYWSGLTTRGATYGGAVGLFVTLLIVVLSDSVWLDVLGMQRSVYPLLYPTIVSMPLTFAALWYFSKSDRSDASMSERERHAEQELVARLGVRQTRSR